MKHTIIHSFWGVLFSSVLACFIIGCASPSTSSGPGTNRAVVAGTTTATVDNVVQWCHLYGIQVISFGDSSVVASINDTRFQQGDFIFEGNCGASYGSYVSALNDPRMIVHVSKGAKQAGTSAITVLLLGNSQIGPCTSSGVLEKSLFEHLGARPLPAK